LGVTLDGVSFAFAVGFSSNTEKVDNIYLSLQAKAQSVQLEGLGDNYELSAHDTTVSINTAIDLSAGIENIALANDVVDYKKSSEQLSSTVGSSSTMTIDIDGASGHVLQTQFDATLKVNNFLYIKGYMGFEVAYRDFTMSDGSVLEDAISISFGAGGLDAYVGLGLEENVLESGEIDFNTDSFIGLALSDVSFYLSAVVSGFHEETIIIPATEYTPQMEVTVNIPDDLWVGAKAHAGSVEFVGFDGITLSAQNIDVEINTTNIVNISDLRTIDFATSGSVGTEETMVLDMSEFSLKATGSVEIQIGEFLYASATIAFEQTEETITVLEQNLETNKYEHTQVQVDAITIGAMDINAFVGVGYGTENQAGFAIENLDFAMITMSDKNSNRSWSAIKASADNIGLVGIDDVNISGSGVIEVSIEANDGSVVDFAQDNITIKPEGSIDGIIVLMDILHLDFMI
jgi:hypothetical protein